MTQVSADQVLVTGRFAYHFAGSGLDFDDGFVMRYTIDGGKITCSRIFEDSLRLARAYSGEPVASPAA
jgi:ketosteroid isomerase-like protein